MQGEFSTASPSSRTNVEKFGTGLKIADDGLPVANYRCPYGDPRQIGAYTILPTMRPQVLLHPVAARDVLRVCSFFRMAEAFDSE